MYAVVERYGVQKFVGVCKQAPVVPGAWQLGSFVLQHFYPKAEDIAYAADDGRCVFCYNPLLEKIAGGGGAALVQAMTQCPSAGRQPRVRGCCSAHMAVS